jgi:hypothetical protein
MSLSDDISVVIEETQIDLQTAKPRTNRWFILGAIAAVLAIVAFFVVRSRSRDAADEPAEQAGLPPENG